MARDKVPLEIRVLILVTILAPLLIANVALSPTAKAYTVEDARWSNNLYITYTKNGSMQSYDSAAATNGANAWNNSVAPIIFVLGGPEVAISDTNAGANGAAGWDDYVSGGGYCNYPTGGFEEFSRAYVTLNIYYMQNYSDLLRQQTAAHELGHAVGLGHSSDPTALMYGPPNNTYGPVTDDINGTDYIYGHSCN